MTVLGWIEIETEGNCVLECSPYYDLKEWLEYVKEEKVNQLEDAWHGDNQ